MAVQFSDDVRNAVADAVEVAVGASPFLQIRDGAKPTLPSDADAGNLLAEIPVPANWLADSAAGIKTLLGTWSVNAVAAGTAAHFRLKNNAKTITKMQGSITIAGSGGDMIIDNAGIVIGQLVSVSQYTITTGNA